MNPRQRYALEHPLARVDLNPRTLASYLVKKEAVRALRVGGGDRECWQYNPEDPEKMSYMAATSLTDFLLARIASREMAARDMQDQERLGRPLLRLLGGGTGIREIVDPARVLAECEAKRRIVARHRACDDVSYGDDSTCPDLRDLALPHADHPDYREEWRP